MVTELFLVQTFVLRHPVLNLKLFLLQALLPRYRKMASNESIVFMDSGISDEEKNDGRNVSVVQCADNPGVVNRKKIDSNYR